MKFVDLVLFSIVLSSFIFIVLFFLYEYREKLITQKGSDEITTINNKRHWTSAETFVAAYIAIYERNISPAMLYTIAELTNRTIGSVLGKINRLETIGGKPQSVSTLGVLTYYKVNKMGRDAANERYLTLLQSMKVTYQTNLMKYS